MQAVNKLEINVVSKYIKRFLSIRFGNEWIIKCLFNLKHQKIQIFYKCLQKYLFENLYSMIFLFTI